jgi:hypothetical protein
MLIVDTKATNIANKPKSERVYNLVRIGLTRTGIIVAITVPDVTIKKFFNNSWYILRNFFIKVVIQF